MSGKKYLTHNQVSLERAYKVIKDPIVTEKTTLGSQNSQFSFIVDTSATKYEIARSVEMVFKVNVLNVTTMIRKGKSKRFKGRMGKRPDLKRACVKLKPGQTIDIGAGF